MIISMSNSTSGKSLRFRDPQSVSVHCTGQTIRAEHWLLSKLGPEPLSEEFLRADYLWAKSHGRRVERAKQFIMNAAIVVGVGNIYASESLVSCRAFIHAVRCRTNLPKGPIRAHSPQPSKTCLKKR